MSLFHPAGDKLSRFVNGLKKTHIFGEKRTSSPYVYVKSESC